MKITKQRLKEIIKEELEFMGAAIDDIPEPPEEEPTRDRAFDSPEGRLITKIQAREVLRNMTRKELKDLVMNLDAATVAELRHLLANPMYAPTGEFDSLPQIGDDPRDQSPLEEGWGQGDTAYQQATQLLGKHAQMHGLRNAVATALRQKRVSPQQVRDAAQGAASSYQVAQRLGLG